MRPSGTGPSLPSPSPPECARVKSLILGADAVETVKVRVGDGVLARGRTKYFMFIQMQVAGLRWCGVIQQLKIDRRYWLWHSTNHCTNWEENKCYLL